MRASDGAEHPLDGLGADPGAHRVRRLRGPEVGVVDRSLARRRPAGGGAAQLLGLPEEERTLVERAALVHDIGALGVSTGIWDKAGPWSAAERERVRIHPYLTERVLARPPQLAAIGAVASLHHERLDGSGYPRGSEWVRPSR